MRGLGKEGSGEEREASGEVLASARELNLVKQLREKLHALSASFRRKPESSADSALGTGFRQCDEFDHQGW
jgi:hypothetical protein